MADTNDINYRQNQPMSLDRKISFSLLFAMGLQFGGTVWWAATTNADVSYHGKQIAKLEVIVEDQRSESAGLSGRVIRLEEKVDQGNELLTKILENLQER